MKYKNALLLASIALLTACGEGEIQTMKPSIEPGELIYSFPADGQSEVSPRADIILRFSHVITDEDLTRRIVLSDGDKTTPFTVTPIDGGRSLKLTPVNKLKISTNYTVTFDGSLQAEGGREVYSPNAVGAVGIQFQTRADITGIAELDNLDSAFAVEEMTPSHTGFFKPMDFSTFRLRLTQPVHPQWKELGGSISIEDENGKSIPASVLAKGRYVTIDPCTTDEKSQCGLSGDKLTAGNHYSIVISGLQSLSGKTLEYSAEFSPKDSGPTVALYQEIIDSGLLAHQSMAEAQRSILNGAVINGIALDSVLMGTAGPSQQTGGLYAEIAYPPSFPGDTPVPLRVAKGSVLLSSSLALNINGTVPVINAETGALQETGMVKVTILSDVTGYLYPNPYSDSVEAPRHVKLFMDVAMNTGQAQPNASLSQDLLWLEMSGIAMVQNGMLTIDAIGIVEPDLLGLELSDATLAFHIVADTNADVQQAALEARPADTTGPTLVSWMPGPDVAIPGNRDQIHRPGDPILLNFDEALDGNSLAGSFTLMADGVPILEADLHQKLDGSVVVLNPSGGLQFGVDYALQISSSLTDLAGNGVTSQTLKFALPDFNTPARSPIALTTYPGYPCVTLGLDLETGAHGQCIDDAEGGPAGQTIPISTLPENRPIMVEFSQSMSLSSIRNGETLIVERINDDGSVAGAVPGRLEKNNRRIRFFPNTAWEPNAYYRYTLMSATTEGDCANAICGENGYPLKTDLLVDPETVGGPNLTIYFRGTEPTDSVMISLRNLPVRDVNANYIVDCPSLADTDCIEPFSHQDSDLDDGITDYLSSENSAKLLVVDEQATLLNVPIGASVGCPAADDCPENKFIYLTFALNVEVIGPEFDADGNNIGVRVLLYPTMLGSTSASVFVDGFGETPTGPLVLRMTYSTPTEENPMGLVEGVISEGNDGRPVFKTSTTLTLDAPNLSLPLGTLLTHDLYSKGINMDLSGAIVFFDDGRMQIIQRNQNVPVIDVNVNVIVPIVDEFLSYADCVASRGPIGIVTCLMDPSESETGDIKIPLIVPENGVWLNFVSSPVKELPSQY